MSETRYDYRLISFELCPFVQRSVITLLEKNVPHTVDYIDLAHKPTWFLALSPLGKVPVLQVGEREVIFESAVINEFIEETAPGRSMLPADPLTRARCRAWIEVGSELLRRMHQLMFSGDEAQARVRVARVREILERFEAVVQGPHFFGEPFTLVDAAVAPALQRLSWCEELEPALDVFADLRQVSAWRDRLLQRPAVQRSTVPEIRELFVRYLRAHEDPAAWIVRGK